LNGAQKQPKQNENNRRKLGKIDDEEDAEKSEAAYGKSFPRFFVCLGFGANFLAKETENFN